MLLRDSTNAWWDDRSTAAVERRDDILAASLAAALERTIRDHGEPDAGGWSWGGVRHTRIAHVLGIPSFSETRVPNRGGRGTLSPLYGDGRHGASWRMVVEMAPEVRAWGVYPGGQSGNPASARYADLIPRWSAGRLDTLRIPRAAADLRAEQVTAVLTLRPAEKP
jgi:penicillin amidase